MTKTVLFDAIDTLFCAYPDKIGMYCRIIDKDARLTVSRERMKKVWDTIVTSTEEEAARELNGGTGLAWEGFNARILELLDYTGDVKTMGKKVLFETWSNPENFIIYDDVLPTLKELKKRRVNISCLSNENHDLNNFFTHFKIKDYFDYIITSEDEGFEKPDKRIFLDALEITKSLPKETIHVGDSLISDYYGAKNAGLQAILIDRDDKIKDNNNITKINSLREIIGFLE